MDYGNDSFGYDELCAMFDEKFSVHDCLARGVSRVRASCSVPRLRVRALVSNNENLNSPKQK